jgi:hypothetical protein
VGRARLVRWWLAPASQLVSLAWRLHHPARAARAARTAQVTSRHYRAGCSPDGPCDPRSPSINLVARLLVRHRPSQPASQRQGDNGTGSPKPAAPHQTRPPPISAIGPWTDRIG